MREDRLDVAGLDEDVSFDCPRCGESVTRRLYGPCETCTEVLRETMAGEASDQVAAEYEPKMNVTPNAVALKE